MSKKHKVLVSHGNVSFAAVFEWFDMKDDNNLVPFGNFYAFVNGRRFGNRRFRYELDFAFYRVLEAFGDFKQKPETYFPELVQESTSILEEIFDWTIERSERDEHGEDPMPDAEFFERFKKFNENTELWERVFDNFYLSDAYHFITGTQIVWAYVWADIKEKLFIKDGAREEQAILPVGTCRNLLLKLQEEVISTQSKHGSSD